MSRKRQTVVATQLPLPEPSPVKLTFDAWYYRNGGMAMPFSFGWQSAAAQMSGRALRDAQTKHKQDLRLWLQKRTEKWAEYQRLVELGEVEPPTNLERLMATAHLPMDDRDRVQAARRVVMKRRERGAPELQGVTFFWEEEGWEPDLTGDSSRAHETAQGAI